MLVSKNGFAILTHITFLTFGPSINMPSMLLNNWLHRIIITKQALHGQSYAYVFVTFICSAKLEHNFNSAEGWLVEICIIAIKEFEWNLMPIYETQLMNEYFAGVSITLFVFLWWLHTYYVASILQHNCVTTNNL